MTLQVVHHKRRTDVFAQTQRQAQIQTHTQAQIQTESPNSAPDPSATSTPTTSTPLPGIEGSSLLQALDAPLMDARIDKSPDTDAGIGGGVGALILSAANGGANGASGGESKPPPVAPTAPLTLSDPSERESHSSLQGDEDDPLSSEFSLGR